MKIDWPRVEIEQYAGAYNYKDDADVRAAMGAAVRRGFIRLGELETVARWKWSGPRVATLVARNTPADVEEITKVSLNANSERLRIGALRCLWGVDWPMASTILHFAFPERYPILDVRAMRSVGGGTHYTYQLWDEYVALCRATAEARGVDLRTLDKALWQAGEREPVA